MVVTVKSIEINNKKENVQRNANTFSFFFVRLVSHIISKSNKLSSWNRKTANDAIFFL